MQYKRLGNTGLTVSRICLGTMSFGRWIDEAASIRLVEDAMERGINFIDTANYMRFFDNVKEKGCDIVRCITSPVNKISIPISYSHGLQN